MSLLYLGKHGNTKIACFKCCVNGLPELSQLLLDFFNNADFQVCNSYSCAFSALTLLVEQHEGIWSVEN